MAPNSFVDDIKFQMTFIQKFQRLQQEITCIVGEIVDDRRNSWGCFDSASRNQLGFGIINQHGFGSDTNVNLMSRNPVNRYTCITRVKVVYCTRVKHVFFVDKLHAFYTCITRVHEHLKYTTFTRFVIFFFCYFVLFPYSFFLHDWLQLPFSPNR